MRKEPHPLMDPAAYYYMPLFKPGASVQWGQQRETVSHVAVSYTHLTLPTNSRV